MRVRMRSAGGISTGVSHGVTADPSDPAGLLQTERRPGPPLHRPDAAMRLLIVWPLGFGQEVCQSVRTFRRSFRSVW